MAGVYEFGRRGVVYLFILHALLLKQLSLR
jgi:hypothetical protein